MDNSAILSGFHKIMQVIYTFVVDTLPGLLNTFSKPILDIVYEISVLRIIYTNLVALLPDSLEEQFNLLLANNNVISFLVGGALGLVLTFSLVRAIIKLFVGTL